MKKTLIILAVFFSVIVLAVGGFFLLRGRGKEEEETSPPAAKVFVETTLEKRPFVSIIPSVDGHWLTLKISRIQEADSLEYELTYKTDGGLSQGAIGGPFVLSGSTYEKKILLGTESSGHYRYHKGIEKGNLMIRLEGGPGPRKFTSDFHLQSGMEKLTSIDGRFSLEADFSQSQSYLVMETIGLPGEIEGDLFNGPYGVFTSGKETTRNGRVEIATEEDTETQVKFWNEKEWDAVKDGQVSKTGVFILTSSS